MLYGIDDIQVDGEDYAIALRNIEQKYGYDEDIATIIKMCNQWENSFHRIERKYHKLVMETAVFEAKIRKITEE
nr:MAG TPA: hypothetical protein [Caudoviricetes sp.]